MGARVSESEMRDYRYIILEKSCRDVSVHALILKFLIWAGSKTIPRIGNLSARSNSRLETCLEPGEATWNRDLRYEELFEISIRHSSVRIFGKTRDSFPPHRCRSACCMRKTTSVMYGLFQLAAALVPTIHALGRLASDQ
jgi:hypothetical protein